MKIRLEIKNYNTTLIERLQVKPKEVKSEETKPLEYSSYFIKRLAEIRKSTKPIDPDEDLTYTFKGNTAPMRFNDFEVPMHIFKSIYNGDRTLEDVEKEQEKLAVDLGRINQGLSYYKSFEQ